MLRWEKEYVINTTLSLRKVIGGLASTRILKLQRKNIYKINSPSASLINSLRAFSYSSCSMVTETSNCSPSASSLISSVINKACRDFLSVPSVYELHKVSRAKMFSA